jgi:hypothetical protein
MLKYVISSNTSVNYALSLYYSCILNSNSADKYFPFFQTEDFSSTINNFFSTTKCSIINVFDIIKDDPKNLLRNIVYQHKKIIKNFESFSEKNHSSIAEAIYLICKKKKQIYYSKNELAKLICSKNEELTFNRKVSSNKREKKSKQLVISFSGDIFGLFGSTFALFKNRDFIIIDETNLEYIISLIKPSSITLVASPHILTSKLLDVMLNHPNIQNNKTLFGILTAPNINTINWLILKICYFEEFFTSSKDIIILSNTNLQYSARDTICLKFYDHNKLKKTFRSSKKNFFRSLGCDVHSNESCIWFKNIILCGLTEEQNNFNSNKLLFLPTCAYLQHCDAFFCKNDNTKKEVVRTREIRVSNVFLAACNGLRLSDNMFPLNFNLGMGFISGWTSSYISSIRFEYGFGDDSIFYHLLFNAGFKQGKIVSIINDVKQHSKIDSPNLVLIGDPESSIEKGKENCNTYQKYVFKLGNRNRIKLNNIFSTSLIIVHIKNRILLKWAKESKLYLRCMENIPNLLYYYISINAKTDWVSIYLYSLKTISLKTLNIFFSNEPFITDEKIKQIILLIHNYVNSYLGGLYDGLIDDERFIKEMRSVLKFISKSKIGESRILQRHILNLHKNILDRIEMESMRIVYACTKIDVNGCLWLPSIYRSHFYTKKICNEGKCYICSGNIIIRKLDSILSKDISSREVHICPRCGIIQDKSVKFSDIHIFCPDYVHSGETIKVKVNLRNLSNKILNITMGLSIAMSNKYEIPGNQSQISLVLEPKEKISETFELSIGYNVVPNQYYFHLFLLSDMVPIFASRPFGVVTNPKRN